MAFSVQKDDRGDDASTHMNTSLRAAKGPLLSLLATICFGLSAELMALSHKGGIPGFQLMFFLRLVQLLTIFVCLPFVRPKLTGESRRQNGTLLLEAILNNVSTTLVYLSFTYAAPGVAFGIIQGSMPLFTACIAFIFLKETLSVVSCCGILVSVIGVVQVAIGMGSEGAISVQQLFLSIALPLAAAFTKGPDMVLARALLKVMPGLTVLLYITCIGTVALLILTYAFETPVWTMSAETAAYVTALGLTQAVGMLFFLGVLKVEKAAIAVALRTLVIPFTILLDYLFMSKTPSLMKSVGISLVILGTVILSINTWWSHRQEAKHWKLLEQLDFNASQRETK